VVEVVVFLWTLHIWWGTLLWTHVPLLFPSRRAHFVLGWLFFITTCWTLTSWVCYEGISHLDHHLTKSWGCWVQIEEGAPLPILLWTTRVLSWSYFHYFYEGTSIFEDFYCNHLYFSHGFTWEHGFGFLVSHAHCICTWYCASPLFSTHGLGGHLTYLRKAFLSFVTRVWRIREIIWLISIVLIVLPNIFLRNFLWGI